MYQMKKRITITMDPAVHERAKRLARKRKTTVSGLFESYLKTAGSSIGEEAALVDEMIGSASLREPPSNTDSLYDALRAKYVAERGK